MNPLSRAAETANAALEQRIAEHERVEAALRASEELLLLALEAAHLGIWSWNIPANEVWWSDQVEPILGLPRNSFAGTYPAYIELTYPEDRPIVDRAIGETLSGARERYDMEHRIVWPDGSLRWLEAKGRVYRDEAGRPLRLIGAITDVTARKQAEAALRESQRFVEQVAAVSPAILIVYDLATREIVYTNPQIAALLGYPATSEVDRGAILEWLGLAEGPEGALWGSLTALAEGEILGYEKRMRDSGGRWCWFAIRASVFARGPDARVAQVLFAALDVTARRQAEEELRRHNHRLVEVQEAERAHIARELHDEVGQTLTGLNLALEVAAQANPAAAQRQIRLAQTLVNDLTARVRQLSLDLRPAILDDLGLLAALAWLVRRYTEQTGVRVDMRHSGLDRPLASEIAITAYRVAQEALTNVARHAEVSAAALQLWTTAETLYLQVADQGRGFDAAATLAAANSSGLAGMRERVRLLGGTLTIDSAPGEGTRIMAELPLSQEA